MKHPAASLLVALLVGLAGPRSHADDGHGDAEEARAQHAARIAAILAEDTADDPAALGARIASAGAEIAPAIFQALCERRLAAPTGEIALERREELALLDATGRLGRACFLPLLPDEVEDLDPASRRAGLQVLGAVGRSDDVERLLALAGDEPAPGSGTLEAFEAAVSGLVGRDPRASSGLRGGFFELPAEYASALARAVAGTRLEARVEWLADLLGFRPELDPTLLSLVTKAANATPALHDEAILEKVRGSLLDSDPQVLRQAAMAVAALGDFGAVAELTDLLASDQEVVRQSAHYALREITGLGLPAEPGGWSAWLESEHRWYEEEAPADLARLAGRRAPEIAEALGRLAKHRFERHRTSLEVARVLENEDPNLRVRACAALRQLGSRLPVPGLIEALDDEEEVAAEAHRALVALTGKDLPLDPEAWRTELLPPAPGSN